MYYFRIPYQYIQHTVLYQEVRTDTRNLTTSIECLWLFHVGIAELRGCLPCPVDFCLSFTTIYVYLWVSLMQYIMYSLQYNTEQLHWNISLEMEKSILHFEKTPQSDFDEVICSPENQTY